MSLDSADTVSGSVWRHNDFNMPTIDTNLPDVTDATVTAGTAQLSTSQILHVPGPCAAAAAPTAEGAAQQPAASPLTLYSISTAKKKHNEGPTALPSAGEILTLWCL